ncbi:carbonic anhydrase [Anabaena subtropica]|uniref:carbonic anhydrase n=1 Tax=Anabaena subtropica FACHB-260 TaxID=2692884 RepID=A0ABR8CNM0_9NOST|nr:carbonic anhydrase [Anabaena subtropica]MBD2344494.1 carbonic anhydrase [Anabaena subtropica FACHB-260]
MSRINGFIGRRNFLGLAGAGSLAVAVTSCVGSVTVSKEEQAIADDISIKLNPVNSQQALKLLLDGNQRFVTRKPRYPNQSQKRLQSIAKAQYPFAAILGCADSRVPAEIVFDQGLGDLFVVRVAGNVASDMAIGSLEYATSVLDTRLIVVLGHRRCGAVEASIKNEPLPGRISYVVEGIKPALAKLQSTSKDINEAAMIANIKYQAEKLQQKSTILAELIKKGTLKIVGASYDIDTGKVSIIS